MRLWPPTSLIDDPIAIAKKPAEVLVEVCSYLAVKASLSTAAVQIARNSLGKFHLSAHFDELAQMLRCALIQMYMTRS